MTKDKITLKTLAIDNLGHSYQVILVREFMYSKGKFVLRFENCPSGWYVKTLLNNASNILGIDSGQDWYCVNIQDILQEIKDLFN